jgi:hypothetical protein
MTSGTFILMNILGAKNWNNIIPVSRLSTTSKMREAYSILFSENKSRAATLFTETCSTSGLAAALRNMSSLEKSPSSALVVKEDFLY